MIWDAPSIPPSELPLEPAPVGARRCGHRRRARLAGGLCRRRRGDRVPVPIIAPIPISESAVAIWRPRARRAAPGDRAQRASMGALSNLWPPVKIVTLLRRGGRGSMAGWERESDYAVITRDKTHRRIVACKVSEISTTTTVVARSCIEGRFAARSDGQLRTFRGYHRPPATCMVEVEIEFVCRSSCWKTRWWHAGSFQRGTSWLSEWLRQFYPC
jgi:hypothetical protein